MMHDPKFIAGGVRAIDLLTSDGRKLCVRAVGEFDSVSSEMECLANLLAMVQQCPDLDPQHASGLDAVWKLARDLSKKMESACRAFETNLGMTN